MYPDVTHDDELDDRINTWLLDLFDCWYNDSQPKPRIRYFELIIKMLMGADMGFEALGRHENKTLCIKTNGNIELVDSLKICGNGFTNTGLNVRFHSFDESFKNEVLRNYYYSHSDIVLCSKCKVCIIRDICGGGKYPHRYSKLNGFDNPSVYCKSIQLLVAHIQNKLFDDMPDVMEKCNIKRLANTL